MDSEVPSVTLSDGRRLAYQSYGDPDGLPIVYNHGGLSAHPDISFADQVARGRHLRLLAVDRPGTGGSSRHPDRRVIDWAEDVGALTTSLGIESFSVLGWSAGGPYALACCRALAPRVRRAAIVGGMCPFGATVTARQLGLRADRILFPLARKSPALAALVVRSSGLLSAQRTQQLLLHELSSADDRAVVGAMTPTEFFAGSREALRNGPGGVVDDYVTLGGDWGFVPEEVQIPVSLFQGSEDTLLPRAHAESLATSLPLSRLEIVEGAGHFLLHRHLDDVLDAVG